MAENTENAEVLEGGEDTSEGAGLSPETQSEESAGLSEGGGGELWDYGAVEEESEAVKIEKAKKSDRAAAIVEAIFYLESEPLDEKSIARISALSLEEVVEAVETLDERYRAESCGVELTRAAGGIMLSPKKEYWDILRTRYGHKNEGKLSRAAMETLAIIAYSQPITRAEIESIRGVQVDNMIRLLIERSLIREAGKKDIPGKPVQYGTTKEFLKVFRLESIADLPKLNEEDAEKFSYD